MMELLTGKNPFYYLSPDQILALHEKGDFPINNLPQWQQEVILKAIHKEPELRFQTMKEFAEAIRAKHAPFILNKDMLKAGEIAATAEKLLGRKKWIKAIGLLGHGEALYPESVKILKLKADYMLRTNKIEDARKYYEKALLLNPRINIQKELGSIYLGEGEFSQAISLLSDHLYKEPSDLEAYNLLLKCYYETGRYDAGMDLAEMILREHKNHPCFINNHLVCNIMLGKGENMSRRLIEGRKWNPFWLYNLDVYTEKKITHNYMKKPSIKSKLLFMDYRFADLKQSELYILDKGNTKGLQKVMTDFIIPIGRKGYKQNSVQIPGGTKYSRRHCVIINSKFDTWLIDLNSTGTYVSGKKVEGRVQLLGVRDIRVVDAIFRLTTDKERLL